VGVVEDATGSSSSSLENRSEQKRTESKSRRKNEQQMPRCRPWSLLVSSLNQPQKRERERKKSLEIREGTTKILPRKRFWVAQQQENYKSHSSESLYVKKKRKKKKKTNY
jgi:hypothetical protein